MSTASYLEQICNDTKIIPEHELQLKKDFKKIFYSDKGYMAWRKKEESIKGTFNQERENLIQDFIKNHNEKTASEFVEESFQAVYELALKHLNARLYGVVENLPKWQIDSSFSLKGSPLKLYQKICGILNTGTQSQRDKLILLLGVYAEGSLSQARKSIAGSGGELIVGGLFNKYGMLKGKDFGTQFTSEGSDTDIVVPFAKRTEDVKAYIAIQVSSNDRTRLTTSELVSGQENYFISFNGCSASSKNTDDIGDEIISKYIKEDIIYVITEKERERAIQTALERLQKEKNKNQPDPNRLSFSENRLKWLEEKSISFEQFMERMISLKSSIIS